MERKIAFFDIDKTLTSETDETIPESVIRSLSLARKNGHLMFINTGRCYQNLEDRFKNIGFDGYVCGCGTNIYIEENGTINEMMHVFQPHSVAEIIIEHARKFRLDILFESKYRVCFDTVHPLLCSGAEKQYNIFKALGYDTVYDIDSKEFEFDKFVVWFENIDDIRKFREVSDTYFSCIDRGGNFREFVPSGYSKASGIQAVIDHYGIDLSQAYAFGDSNNDLPMLEYVPNSVAMGNAEPASLCSKVSYVTAKASEDGIEKALMHFGFI